MSKAFRALGFVSGKTIFVSKDVKTVLCEGMAVAKHHEFMILDSLPGVGATVALEALKQCVRADENTLLVELTPSDVISTSSLWRVILTALGEKPAWRWAERDIQLQRKLAELASAEKRVLICVDDALVMQRKCWQILKHMSDIHYKGFRYGPGVILVANLQDTTSIRFKPQDVILSADKLSLRGLTPAEIRHYIDFQAQRDGVRFHPDFLAEIREALNHESLTEKGLHNLPGTINNAAKHVMRTRRRVDEPITQPATPATPVTQPSSTRARKPVEVGA